MSTLSFIMLVGAAMLVTIFRGTNSFPFDRNAVILIEIDDSHETSSTMDHPDSTLNTALEEGDSLEDDRLVSVHPPIGAFATGTHEPVPLLNDHVRDGFSWDDLVKDLAKVDVPYNSQSAPQVDHAHSLENVREKLANHHNAPTFTEPTAVESSTLEHDHSLENVKTIQQTVQTGTTGLVPQTTSVSHAFQDDDKIDDFSWEDYAQFINPHAAQLTKMDFHHLPATLFTHPTSDDWFLMRHYMDDHHVWALGDELAREYFWQPVKSGA